MDIIRDTKPQKKRKKLVWSLAGVGLLALTVFVPRLLPTAAPTVDGATVWRDTVEFGTMIRQVRGPGTLVPEQMRWITAVTAGRIEQILALPGTEVEQGALIMRMSNPDVDMQLLQAQQQLSQARAALAQLRTNLQTQELTQRGTVATVRTQYLDARRNYETNQRLFDENPDLVARADLERSKELMDELELRLAMEEDRLRVMEETAGEQLDAQEEQIQRLEELVEFNRDRLQSMQVTVPTGGVLAPLEIPLQEGQWVQSGQLGKIAVARCFLVSNHAPDGEGFPPDSDPPEGLDWNFWVGPAPIRPFNINIVKSGYSHTLWLDYGGGRTCGMSEHILDLPYWALGLDFPTRISSFSSKRLIQDNTDAPDTHEVTFEFPGVTLTWSMSQVSSFGFNLQDVTRYTIQGAKVDGVQRRG